MLLLLKFNEFAGRRVRLGANGSGRKRYALSDPISAFLATYSCPMAPSQTCVFKTLTTAPQLPVRVTYFHESLETGVRLLHACSPFARSFAEATFFYSI